MLAGDKFSIVWENDCHSDRYTILNGVLSFLKEEKGMWYCTSHNAVLICINPMNPNIHAILIEQ